MRQREDELDLLDLEADVLDLEAKAITPISLNPELFEKSHQRIKQLVKESMEELYSKFPTELKQSIDFPTIMQSAIRRIIGKRERKQYPNVNQHNEISLKLPTEMWLAILACLDDNSLLMLILSCKMFKNLANSDNARMQLFRLNWDSARHNSAQRMEVDYMRSYSPIFWPNPVPLAPQPFQQRVQPTVVNDDPEEGLEFETPLEKVITDKRILRVFSALDVAEDGFRSEDRNRLIRYNVMMSLCWTTFLVILLNDYVGKVSLLPSREILIEQGALLGIVICILNYITEKRHLINRRASEVIHIIRGYPRPPRLTPQEALRVVIEEEEYERSSLSCAIL